MINRYKINARVSLIKNDAHSENQIGDIGFIKNIKKVKRANNKDIFVFNVITPNSKNATNCWSYKEDLQLLDCKTGIIQW